MVGIYKRTKKHRALMSLKLKNRKFSKETIEKMRKAKKGKKQTKKHVENHRKSIMNNRNFKEVKYNAIHEWIRRRKKKPEFCECCNKEKPYDLANISGKYLRNVNDYKWLCRKCHYNLDRKGKLWK